MPRGNGDDGQYEYMSVDVGQYEHDDTYDDDCMTEL